MVKWHTGRFSPGRGGTTGPRNKTARDPMRFDVIRAFLRVPNFAPAGACVPHDGRRPAAYAAGYCVSPFGLLQAGHLINSFVEHNCRGFQIQTDEHRREGRITDHCLFQES